MEELSRFLTQTVGLRPAYTLKLQEYQTSRSFKKGGAIDRGGGVCHFIGFVTNGVLRSFLTNNGEEFNNDFISRVVSPVSTAVF